MNVYYLGVSWNPGFVGNGVKEPAPASGHGKVKRHSTLLELVVPGKGLNLSSIFW